MLLWANPGPPGSTPASAHPSPYCCCPWGWTQPSAGGSARWGTRLSHGTAEPNPAQSKPAGCIFHFFLLIAGCFSLILPLVLASTTGGLFCCCFWCNEDDVLRHSPQGRRSIKQLHQQSGRYCAFPQSKQVICRSDTARMLISWTGAGQGPLQPWCLSISSLCSQKKRRRRTRGCSLNSTEGNK